MNFYKHYLGDYLRDTADLSLLEHGAYRLLLDHYYATEKPLPAVIETLYRVCGAVRKDEQHAVRAVAERFFPVGEDGLRHNKRADEEIGKRAVQAETNRATGKRGGRPKKTEQETERITESVSAEKTERETESVSEMKPNGNPNHSQKRLSVSNETGGQAADPIFGDGLAFLMGKGVKERGARSFLGSMRKTVGDMAAAELLAAAEREDVSDPIPWLRKAAETRGIRQPGFLPAGVRMED